MKICSDIYLFLKGHSFSGATLGIHLPEKIMSADQYPSSHIFTPNGDYRLFLHDFFAFVDVVADNIVTYFILFSVVCSETA